MQNKKTSSASSLSKESSGDRSSLDILGASCNKAKFFNFIDVLELSPVSQELQAGEEQKNPKSLRSLQNAQRDTTNLAVKLIYVGFFYVDNCFSNSARRNLRCISEATLSRLCAREIRVRL